MSIFGSILSRVFGRGPVTAPTPHPDSAVLSAPAEPEIAAGQAPAMNPFDVNALLTSLAAAHGQELQWQTSIVDLMKLVGIDSSLQARQALARELHYAGDVSDSARMNIWLHEQVMAKLAENGGNVPDDLRS
ncbi:DUF3597 domain-containing protein [Plastoroseomonas arctica]|uniref:DUF3597 domain-containing protein n=1 Tax=Plastoroseomonas arctica TaxID=1509237 RepID=A0AAF1KNW8_9PROT|nr:DUF3597 domain-containing protein [Plastoroseomonas arctica]MBR0655138.1 DUF3597 domain-containing protein [Plastoroseomonas arctica]